MCMPGAQSTTIGQAEGENAAVEAQLAGQTYQENAAYSPLYTQLAMSNLNQYMGGPNGLLSLYQNQIAPAATNATIAGNTATRTANVGDLNALIPGMTAATRTASPQAAGLIDTLTGQAASNLNYGVNLSPTQTTQVQQSVRAGQEARGMGTGTGDATQEAFAQTDAGNQLYQQRLGNASQAAGQAQNFYSGIIPSILNGQSNPSVAAGLMGTGTGQIAPAQSSEFNPAGGLASEYMSTNDQVSMSNSQERLKAAQGYISDGMGVMSAAAGASY